MDLSNQIENSFSRRGFMKGALLGAGALTLSSRLASAEMLLAGKTASDIHGMGVEKGLVRINANENPLGASPRAIEAVAQHMFEMNRYSFSTDLPLKLHKHHDISFGDIELDFEDPASFRKLREMNRVLVSAGSGPIVQMIGVMGVGDGNGEAIE
ncbi:MAG: twin-arginine translocation signal domain-containing protein, partial [Candidatus Latescibacteria bacterium]|nr:twin-arginine translocation signal domain-containing protein [Candidatus Latescibacterota bacterium]